MSVALLAGALNTETKAQKRKRLKFKFDELLFLLSLGLSWSCCGSGCAGVLVVCGLCAPLWTCVSVCAPANSPGLAQAQSCSGSLSHHSSQH